MADFLQADTAQQLELVLLGPLAAQVVDLLSRGLVQAKASTSVTPAQPCPRIYTSTPPAPLPYSVLLVGVLTTSPTPAVVPTTESSSGVEESASLKAKVSYISDDFLHQHISPTLVAPSSSVNSSSSLTFTSVVAFSVVVVPELAIPAEAYLEKSNRPSGGKDYLCCLCLLRNSSLDSILTCQKTFRNNHWLSYLWQGLPECCIPL